jgi:DNA-binding Xre family transcriptional regulator
MPIKDLSNRGRIPRLGKIRLGIKVPGSKSEYPKATDYFVCPEEVKAVYGEKPKRLNIAFHSDDIEEVFPQYYKRYGKSTGLVCKGDGEIANVMNVEIGEFEETECLGTECEFYKSDKPSCKRVGNLHFIILGVNRFGVYQLDTGSINTILNINGGIDYVKEITGGRIKLVPFILEVIPQEVSPDGKKKTVWVLRLEADIPKMMKSLESKPGQIFSISPVKGIEEDLHKDDIVITNQHRAKKELFDDIKELMDITGISEEELAKIKIERFGEIETKDLTIEQLNEVKEILEEKLEEGISGDKQPSIL